MAMSPKSSDYGPSPDKPSEPEPVNPSYQSQGVVPDTAVAAAAPDLPFKKKRTQYEIEKDLLSLKQKYKSYDVFIFKCPCCTLFTYLHRTTCQQCF
mmetsp:Transcript_2348/g.3537  ORF Transcript_2348/g.3537 Transcript_2348/m.3537 type:complete len:96 (-) Transcript_2348:2658-2945(-)